MPRYSWQGSTIAQADVKENLQYRHAILRPQEGLSAEELSALPAKLQRHGMVAIPGTEEDQPVIRVRGFTKASDLFNVLKQEGLTNSPFSGKEPLEEELHPEVKDWRKRFRENTIPLAGGVYLIADAMPIMSGLARKNNADILSGALFATTSLALVLFGRKNPEIQMGNIYAQFKDYLAQEGIEINSDQGLALEQLKTDPTYINRLINFLYEHPILFNNTIQGYGCYQGHVAGRQYNNPWRNVAGLSGAFGQWGGLIIPEDKYAGLDPVTKSQKLAARAEGKEKENGFNTRFVDNPVAWIREKPLRLTAIGTLTQNALVGGSVLFKDRHEINQYFGYASNKYEFRPGRIVSDITRSTKELMKHAPAGASAEELKQQINRHKAQRFIGVSPIFNAIANTLYGMSSKEDRSVNLDKAGYIDELLGLAADIYSRVPESQRDEKIARFAGFLKSQPDVNINEQDIRQRVTQKIEALEQSGWANKIANENHAPQPSVAL